MTSEVYFKLSDDYLEVLQVMVVVLLVVLRKHCWLVVTGIFGL